MTVTTSRPATAPSGPPPPAAAAPAPLYTHKQVLVILSGLLLGMFLAALDQTVVATSIRTIADDLHGFSLQAWATTAFLITSTISTPLYGKLSDLYGRKQFFLLAIGIFVIGSMLCGLSQSIYQLAGFRALQGIGAGGLFSMALAIIGDIVPPRERAKYQGYFLAVFGTASVLGPVVGGTLAGQASILGVTGWRWIFYVNVPIGLAALVVVTKVLHLPHTKRAHRIDVPGALLLIVTLVPLLTIAEQGRTWGWGSGKALLCYGIGIAGLIGFLAAERAYGEDALLPFRVFRIRTVSVTAVSSVITGIAMFGALALIPQYLQVVRGSSPTVGGLQTIPIVAGLMTGSIISGQAIARTGRYKIFPVVGTALMTVALVMFHFLVHADTPLWQVMVVMAVFGLGLGGNMQPLILAAQNAVSPREIGVATSSVTFFRQMGGTIGTAIFLSVLFSTVGDNIRGAIGTASKTPAFQAALAAHPDQARLLAGGAGRALDDTSFINRLDPALALPFKQGFTSSMDLVFILGAAVALVGFLVVQLLPELPLRTQAAAAAVAAEDRAEATEEAARGRTTLATGGAPTDGAASTAPTTALPSSPAVTAASGAASSAASSVAPVSAGAAASSSEQPSRASS